MKKTINTLKVKVGRLFGILHSASADDASGGHPCRIVGGGGC